jgi:hypothetical protein
MKKTFKRELAIILLVWLIYIVETKDASIIEILVWPVFTFVTAAFGIDQYSKLQQRGTQSSDRGRPEHRGERTSWEDEYPDIGNDK